MGYLKQLLIKVDERGYRRWEEVPPEVLEELGLTELAPASGPIWAGNKKDGLDQSVDGTPQEGKA